MKLNQLEIYDILATEKIADKNTGVYSVNFEYLLDKLTINKEEKNEILEKYKKNHMYEEDLHLKKISEILDNKIEKFSSDFWELFFFRKHNYLNAYKERKWNEFNEGYENTKDVRKKVKILKNLNITHDELEKFLTKLTYQQDGYVNLWFQLKKKNKDKSLSEEMQKILDNYAKIDKDEGQKAIFYSYFEKTDKLEELYEKNKNSEFKRIIEDELRKFKDLDVEEFNLFESNHIETVYRKNITVNNNALIYNLGKNQKIINKVIEIINSFLSQNIYKLKYDYDDYDEYQQKHTYTIESYAEYALNENEELIKKSIQFLPELLIKKDYIEIFKEDSYVNNDMNHFFRQYLKSAELYKKLDTNLKENLEKQKVKSKI